MPPVLLTAFRALRQLTVQIENVPSHPSSETLPSTLNPAVTFFNLIPPFYLLKIRTPRRHFQPSISSGAGAGHRVHTERSESPRAARRDLVFVLVMTRAWERLSDVSKPSFFPSTRPHGLVLSFFLLILLKFREPRRFSFHPFGVHHGPTAFSLTEVLRDTSLRTGLAACTPCPRCVLQERTAQCSRKANAFRGPPWSP